MKDQGQAVWMTRQFPTVDRAPWREVGQGAHFVSDRADLRLAATLGSCVAIFLHAPAARIGGMNHIFQSVDAGPAGSHAVTAEIDRLVASMARMGVAQRDLIAQAAGGARTLGRGRDVGGEIAAACLRHLSTLSIPVAGSDLGGQRPRRVLFDPTSGDLRITYPGTAMGEVTLMSSMRQSTGV
ncbi:chemotaxis protein CheD [Jannaschia rubra]|uniref:chemotaxis protein CheD n=1 Tax=Jannaschia rubra TaxID=282197 RepID=UPI002493CA5D|nr:chemotaxis protein CheD [Jannaschia rubra]